MVKNGAHGDEHIGLLIGAVRRRIKQALGSHARRYDLTTQQFWSLVAIYEHPGFSLGELAAHLRMDSPTASRVVFTLMNRKLVGVRGDAADRRRARLHLRAPGAALAKDLHELATAVRAAVVQGLSSTEQAALRASLRKIIANMDRFQDSNTTEVSAEANSLPTSPQSRQPNRHSQRR
ncbi:MAG: MarR family winged helix-turn-helix transcriptional regulator [Candidatus Binatia bacterium]